MYTHFFFLEFAFEKAASFPFIRIERRTHQMVGMFFWLCLYTLARAVLGALFPRDLRGWPYSSYVVALAHQIMVLPTLWYRGSVVECLNTSLAYFVSDTVMNLESFGAPHAVHHGVSIILLVASKNALSHVAQVASTEWLVWLELGSAGISLSPLVGGAPRTRAALYGLTRVVTVAKMVHTYSTVTDAALSACYVISLPLLLHNAFVFKHMLGKALKS
ncbi:MAG: hypothetical protein CL450_09230 [Acidimicrobiaceae bacterium]|nr:hypothetical protein [Acidimicrobiaceae bacterium]